MALEMHSKELRGGTYLAPIFMATMLVALVLPMFFEVYRTVYYGTMSYDDYSRYLLWVLGEPGGKIPPSPHVYRIGSVILAAPFYQLPVILFSGQGIHHAPVVMQPEYVRALQAMCAANAAYAAISACIVGLYLAFWRNVSVGWAFSATSSSVADALSRHGLRRRRSDAAARNRGHCDDRAQDRHLRRRRHPRDNRQ